MSNDRSAETMFTGTRFRSKYHVHPSLELTSFTDGVHGYNGQWKNDIGAGGMVVNYLRK